MSSHCDKLSHNSTRLLVYKTLFISYLSVIFVQQPCLFPISPFLNKSRPLSVYPQPNPPHEHVSRPSLLYSQVDGIAEDQTCSVINLLMRRILIQHYGRNTRFLQVVLWGNHAGLHRRYCGFHQLHDKQI
jgi:hypothetical protein